MPTTSVRRRTSLFSRSWRVVGPYLAPVLLGKGGEGKNLRAGLGVYLEGYATGAPSYTTCPDANLPDPR